MVIGVGGNIAGLAVSHRIVVQCVVSLVAHRWSAVAIAVATIDAQFLPLLAALAIHPLHHLHCCHRIAIVHTIATESPLHATLTLRFLVILMCMWWKSFKARRNPRRMQRTLDRDCERCLPPAPRRADFSPPGACACEVGVQSRGERE